MTWLVTGGCGFVGSNLADALMTQGNAVVVLDNLQRHGSAENLAWLRQRHGSAWRFEQLDVRNSDAVSALVFEIRPAVIAHLAGQVAMTTSLADPQMDFQINAGGTLNVLEAVRRNSPQTIVLYSSTNKVYGSLERFRYEETDTRYLAIDNPMGFDEDLPLDGSSPYGCSKLAGEQYVRDYCRMFDVPTIVFRHSSIYGEHQFATFDQGWVGWFCAKACEIKSGQTRSFTIAGNGKQVRDVLHADDLVRAYFAAVRRIDGAAGQIFNLGGGMENSLSLLELFAKLEQRLGVSMNFEPKPWRKADQRVFVANNARAAAALGWTPMIGVDEGLDRMVRWTDAVRLQHS